MFQKSIYTEGNSMNLSKSISSLPIAESTQLEDSRISKNIQKLTPKRKQLQSRVHRSYKTGMSHNSMNQIDPLVYADTQSRGLVSRLIKYHDSSLSASDKSLYQRNLYSKPGDFPVVHLKKSEITYSPKRNMNTMQPPVRIAPPDKSIYQTSTRSNILRSGSLSNLSGSLSNLLPDAERNKACNDNEPLTPSNDIEAVPTRSVLDALKEISRKRINNEEYDADRHKKQCKDVCEIDGFQNSSKKRSRESVTVTSPTKSNISPTEQNLQKKRLITKNNDILSSLSSSIPSITPKRRNYDKIIPRNCIEGISTHRAEVNNTVVDKEPSELNMSISRPSSVCTISPETLQNNQEYSGSSQTSVKSVPSTASKITLFNKKINAIEVQKNHNFYSDDEDTSTISFVKPKTSTSSVDCGDVVRRVDKSKLSLMLSCLSGDFFDDDVKPKSVDVVDKVETPTSKPSIAVPDKVDNSSSASSINLLKPADKVEDKTATSIAKPIISFGTPVITPTTVSSLPTSITSAVAASSVPNTLTSTTTTSLATTNSTPAAPLICIGATPTFNFTPKKPDEKVAASVPSTTSTSVSPFFGVPITSTGMNSTIKSPTSTGIKLNSSENFMNFNSPSIIANVSAATAAAASVTTTVSTPQSLSFTSTAPISFTAFTSPKSFSVVSTVADTQVTLSLPSSVVSSSNTIASSSSTSLNFFQNPSTKVTAATSSAAEPTVSFTFTRPNVNKIGDSSISKPPATAAPSLPVFGSLNNTQPTLDFGKNNNLMNFGSLPQPQTVTAAPALPTSSFSFGKSDENASSTMPKASSFSFGGANAINPVAASSASNLFNTNSQTTPSFASANPTPVSAMKPSGGFSFNTNPVKPLGAAAEMPTFGNGMADKNPLQKAADNVPIFGSSSNMNSNISTTVASMFSFSTPTVSTANATTTNSTFSFGQSNTNQMANNNTSNVFGQSTPSLFSNNNNSNNNASTTQSAFGGGLNDSIKPVTFGSSSSINSGIFGSNASNATTLNNGQNTFGSFGNTAQPANANTFIFGGGNSSNNNNTTISAFSSPPTTAPPPFGANMSSNNSTTSIAPISNSFGFDRPNINDNNNSLSKPFEFGGGGGGIGGGNNVNNNSMNLAPQNSSFSFGQQGGNANTGTPFSFGGNAAAGNTNNQLGGNNDSVFKFSSNDNTTNNNSTNLFGAAAPASNAFAFGGGSAGDAKSPFGQQNPSPFGGNNNNAVANNNSSNLFGSAPSATFGAPANNSLSGGQFNFTANTQQQQQQQSQQSSGVFNFTSPNNISNNSPFSNVAQPGNNMGGGMFSIGVGGSPAPGKRPIRIASRRMNK